MAEISIQPDPCPHCGANMASCREGDECTECFYLRVAGEALDNVQACIGKPLEWGS